MKPDAEKGTAFDEAPIEPHDVATPPLDAVPQGDGSASSALMEQLREELEAASRSAAESQDHYLRSLAELENFKKRSLRERGEALRYAAEPLARDVIPLVDNLERALEHARASGDASPVVAGVEMVLKDALETLQRHGVERIDALGQAFDPAFHEAVAQVADGETPANHVVQQFLPGYRLHERLLRAAQVSVAMDQGPGAK